MITGANGIQIVTDQDAIIPAAVYPTFGQATVPAQTVLIGAAANSRAGTIYGPCCRVNISAVSSAFTGGQDRQDYRTVNPQDTTTTTATLKTSLATSARAALQTQVQNGESLLTSFACASQVSTDHQPGDEATQVTITMSETCHALAYHTEALHDAISEAIGRQAATLRESYTPTSDLALSLKGAQMSDQHTATMQVGGTQTYSYQFSQQEQQQLKDRIAGKGKNEATTLILHTPGVQTVSINGGDPGMTTIPTDASRIHILFLVGA